MARRAGYSTRAFYILGIHRRQSHLLGGRGITRMYLLLDTAHLHVSADVPFRSRFLAEGALGRSVHVPSLVLGRRRCALSVGEGHASRVLAYDASVRRGCGPSVVRQDLRARTGLYYDPHDRVERLHPARGRHVGKYALREEPRVI